MRRPIAGAMMRSSPMSCANWPGSSDCAPSESAWSGSLCTSISKPSAPAATVARADLKNIHVAQHHLNLRRVHYFADGEQAEFIRGFAHELQAWLAHPLESVRRCAWFESAAAQNFCPRFRDAFRDGKDLFTRFHRAWPGGNGNLRSSNADTPAKIDNRAFRLELAARKFERLRDAHDFAHPVEQFKIAMIEVPMHADGSKDGMRFTGGTVYVKTVSYEAIDHLLDLRVGSAFLHHDDHMDFPFPSLRVVAELWPRCFFLYAL